MLKVLSACRLLLLSGVLFFSASVVHAQEPQTLTLNDAIRIALDQNYGLKSSANTMRQRENTLRGAKYFLFPRVSASSSVGRNFGLSFDQTIGGLTNYSVDRVSFSSGASLPIFTGFRDWAFLKQSRLGVEGQNFSHERQRQLVVFLVMNQFLSLSQALSQVTIQEENLAAQQQLLEQIEQFVEAGTRPVSDLFQQQAAAANAELSVLDAERNVEAAQNLLVQTLQLDPFEVYSFEVPDLSDKPLIPEQYDVEELVKTAFDRRFDLRAQEVSIQFSEQQIRSARGGWMPSVSLSAGVGTSYSSASLGFQTESFGDQLENNLSQSVSLSLSIPIFDNFSTSVNVQSAKIGYDDAKLQLENLKQGISLDVRQAYLDYLRDEKYLDVTGTQLAAAALALEAAQERYNVGSSTLVELAQAQSSYVAASTNRVNAIDNFFFRKLQIDYYIGVLDPSLPLFE